MMDFLPVSRADMKKRGWDELDFVYVIGDAYVDHPSFGHGHHQPAPGIQRLHGWESSPSRIGRTKKALQVLGEPRLAFLVSAGNMDSMVNHYSVSKKRRKTDAYTPGGVMGKRPDYAVTVYCNLIRQGLQAGAHHRRRDRGQPAPSGPL